MSTAPLKPYTPQEYLALERAAENRSKFYRGEIFSMAGSSRQHDRICFNLTAALQRALKDSPCQGFTGNMRVRVQPTGLYTYPDASVACGEVEFDDSEVDTLLNPRIVFEVLSPSTERRDRGWKFDQYRQIPSLMDYVLLAQDEPRIERFERLPDDSWRWSVTTGIESSINLDPIQQQIPLREVYADVEFIVAESRPPQNAV